jgi:hypothetical protein
MFKSGFLLETDHHLQAAMFNKSNVIVWQDDEIIYYGGPIESFTENSITILGNRFLKETCQFRIR